jgi:4-hydroxy-tetrahydrodipicolinate reductase
VAVAGALGRMGQAVTRMVEADPALALAARFDRPDAEGEGLVSAAQALAAADVVIDFTLPHAAAALAEAAAGRGGPALVLGPTGWEAAEIARVAAAAKAIPIVRAGNFSLGVNLLMGMVRQAARALPADAWDVEVFEAHHRHKVDAPSGTALMLGKAAAEGRGVELDAVARRARDGITGERPIGEIGFAVLRGGGIVGDHSVTFASEEETLTLSHSGRDRALFARGAVAAAKWVVGRAAGEYDMQDVLGFR